MLTISEVCVKAVTKEVIEKNRAVCLSFWWAFDWRSCSSCQFCRSPAGIMPVCLIVKVSALSMSNAIFNFCVHISCASFRHFKCGCLCTFPPVGSVTVHCVHLQVHPGAIRFRSRLSRSFLKCFKTLILYFTCDSAKGELCGSLSWTMDVQCMKALHRSLEQCAVAAANWVWSTIALVYMWPRVPLQSHMAWALPLRPSSHNRVLNFLLKSNATLKCSAQHSCGLCYSR